MFSKINLKRFRVSTPSAFVGSNTYDAALDGLRFVAFALVFIHHMPKFDWQPLVVAKTYGWAGVDLFFVISAYLLFSNLNRERDLNGRVNHRRYLARRFLRIFPLMAVYLIFVLLAFGPTRAEWPLRLVGSLLFFDNFNAWIFGSLNGSFYAVAHLWTLSFEMQVYLVLPLLLAAYKKLGTSRFFIGLLGYSIACAFARYGLSIGGAKHPLVYVMPFVRPEAIFIGLVLAVYRPKWHWSLSAIAAAVLGAVVVTTPRPWSDDFAAVVQYPVIALTAGCLLDLAIRSPLRAVLCWKPLVQLGTISYGLYVFHYLVRHVMRAVFDWAGIAQTGTIINWLSFSGSIFILTVVLALLSYRFLERPFLKLKLKKSVTPDIVEAQKL